MTNKCIALLVALLIYCAPLYGQELHVLGGMLTDTANHDQSYTWSLEYLQKIKEHLAFSVSWLNEGHLPNNHRDGIAVQLWGQTKRLDNRFVLAAGVGPYVYYDTELVRNGRGFSDTHGVGGIFTLAGLWYTESPWIIQLRTNMVKTNDIDTYSAMIGLGYQLDYSSEHRPSGEAAPHREKMTNNEITVFVGQTIVNSFDSQNSAAESIEYRRGVARYLDWTIAWLYEGDDRLIRRNGVLSQIWAVRSFLEGQLALGIGIGPYVLVDQYRSPGPSESSDTFAGVITLTASYRFSSPWLVRISWNRIATGYNSDSDVILGGIGYRF